MTGGSSGLGLALAILLTQKGADVSIVARNEERLASALVRLEVRACVPYEFVYLLNTVFCAKQAARKTPNQLLRSYSFDLYDPANAAEALRVACEPHGGRSPDAAFLCAGKSTPGFFVEQSVDTLRQGMDDGYWVQAWSAMVSSPYNLHALCRSLVTKAATNHMVNTQAKGKIILVSSMLGLLSIVGYASYSPAKWALRGMLFVSSKQYYETHAYTIGRVGRDPAF